MGESRQRAEGRLKGAAVLVLVLCGALLPGLNAAAQPTAPEGLRWLVRAGLLLTLLLIGYLLWLLRGAVTEGQRQLEPLTRDRRVASSMTRLATAAMVVALAGLGVGLWYSLQPSDFLRGLLAGIFGFMPLGIGWLAYRAYRQMDEYAQRVQERAAALAFLLSMMAAMVDFVAAQVSKVVIPLWTLDVFGMLIYGAGVLAQQRGGQPRGDG
ncbi:hypothetical protein [Deinococcus sp.]|uniref:hypothetical protein n=1 Tax=Deinococcus sp. TaxID=47478 RepID=UPI003CC56429